MTGVDQKNALLAGDPTAKDQTRTVPSHAGDLLVRGLNRAEVLKLKGLRADGTLDAAEFEAHMVAKGMVTPEMTPAEVEKWQQADLAGGPLGDVSDAIAELSGLGEGASKSGVSRPRARRRA